MLKSTPTASPWRQRPPTNQPRPTWADQAAARPARPLKRTRRSQRRVPAGPDDDTTWILPLRTFSVRSSSDSSNQSAGFRRRARSPPKKAHQYPDARVVGNRGPTAAAGRRPRPGQVRPTFFQPSPIRPRLIHVPSEALQSGFATSAIGTAVSPPASPPAWVSGLSGPRRDAASSLERKQAGFHSLRGPSGLTCVSLSQSQRLPFPSAPPSVIDAGPFGRRPSSPSGPRAPLMPWGFQFTAGGSGLPVYTLPGSAWAPNHFVRQEPRQDFRELQPQIPVVNPPLTSHELKANAVSLGNAFMPLSLAPNTAPPAGMMPAASAAPKLETTQVPGCARIGVNAGKFISPPTSSSSIRQLAPSWAFRNEYESKEATVFSSADRIEGRTFPTLSEPMRQIQTVASSMPTASATYCMRATIAMNRPISQSTIHGHPQHKSMPPRQTERYRDQGDEPGLKLVRRKPTWAAPTTASITSHPPPLPSDYAVSAVDLAAPPRRQGRVSRKVSKPRDSTAVDTSLVPSAEGSRGAVRVKAKRSSRREKISRRTGQVAPNEASSQPAQSVALGEVVSVVYEDRVERANERDGLCEREPSQPRRVRRSDATKRGRPIALRQRPSLVNGLPCGRRMSRTSEGSRANRRSIADAAKQRRTKTATRRSTHRVPHGVGSLPVSDNSALGENQRDHVQQPVHTEGPVRAEHSCEGHPVWAAPSVSGAALAPEVETVHEERPVCKQTPVREEPPVHSQQHGGNGDYEGQPSLEEQLALPASLPYSYPLLQAGVSVPENLYPENVASSFFDMDMAEKAMEPSSVKLDNGVLISHDSQDTDDQSSDSSSAEGLQTPPRFPLVAIDSHGPTSPEKSDPPPQRAAGHSDWPGKSFPGGTFHSELSALRVSPQSSVDEPKAPNDLGEVGRNLCVSDQSYGDFDGSDSPLFTTSQRVLTDDQPERIRACPLLGSGPRPHGNELDPSHGSPSDTADMDVPKPLQLLRPLTAALPAGTFDADASTTHFSSGHYLNDHLSQSEVQGYDTDRSKKDDVFEERPSHPNLSDSDVQSSDAHSDTDSFDNLISVHSVASVPMAETTSAEFMASDVVAVMEGLESPTREVKDRRLGFAMSHDEWVVVAGGQPIDESSSAGKPLSGFSSAASEENAQRVSGSGQAKHQDKRQSPQIDLGLALSKEEIEIDIRQGLDDKQKSSHPLTPAVKDCLSASSFATLDESASKRHALPANLLASLPLATCGSGESLSIISEEPSLLPTTSRETQRSTTTESPHALPTPEVSDMPASGVAYAHVIQLDVDDTLIPTSQLCEKNWLDKELEDLPEGFRERFSVLDRQLTRLFSELHHMVVHEDVLGLDQIKVDGLPQQPVQAAGQGDQLGKRKAPSSEILATPAEADATVKPFEPQSLVGALESPGAATATHTDASDVEKAGVSSATEPVVPFEKALPETPSTNSGSDPTSLSSSAQTTVCPGLPLSKVGSRDAPPIFSSGSLTPRGKQPRTPRGVTRTTTNGTFDDRAEHKGPQGAPIEAKSLSFDSPTSLQASLNGGMEGCPKQCNQADPPSTDSAPSALAPSPTAVATVLNLGEQEGLPAGSTSQRIERNYVLSVVIMTNATMSHIRTIFPKFLPTLTAFFVEKQIYLEDLVCSARDLWGEEFPFEHFYDFWKCWTLEDVLSQLRHDGVRTLTVLSIGDDEPERKAAAYVKQEMPDLVRGTKLVKMAAHPTIEEISFQIEYIIANLRDYIQRPTAFDVVLKVTDMTEAVQQRLLRSVERANRRSDVLKHLLSIGSYQTQSTVKLAQEEKSDASLAGGGDVMNGRAKALQSMDSTISNDSSDLESADRDGDLAVPRTAGQEGNANDSRRSDDSNANNAKSSGTINEAQDNDGRSNAIVTKRPSEDPIDDDSDAEQDSFNLYVLETPQTESPDPPNPFEAALIQFELKFDHFHKLFDRLRTAVPPQSNAPFPKEEDLLQPTESSAFKQVQAPAPSDNKSAPLDSFFDGDRWSPSSDFRVLTNLPLISRSLTDAARETGGIRSFLRRQIDPLMPAHRKELIALGRDAITFLRQVQSELNVVLSQTVLEDTGKLDPLKSIELDEADLNQQRGGDIIFGLIHNVLRFLLLYPTMFVEFTRKDHQTLTAVVLQNLLEVLYVDYQLGPAIVSVSEGLPGSPSSVQTSAAFTVSTDSPPRPT